MINNQTSLSYDLGTYGAWGCLARNAGGAIAIYNICQLDHFEISLAEIIDMIKKGHGFRFRGALGTKVHVVNKVLRQLDFDVQFQGTFHSLNQIVNHQYFYILYHNEDWQWYYQAGHFVSKFRFVLFNTNHIYESIQQFRTFEKVTSPIWLFTVD